MDNKIMCIDYDSDWVAALTKEANFQNIEVDHFPTMVEAIQILNCSANVYYCIVINYSDLLDSTDITKLVEDIKQKVPFTKIVFSIDSNNPDIIASVLLTYANGYVIKPYSIEDILRVSKQKINYKPRHATDLNIKISGISDIGKNIEDLSNQGRTEQMHNMNNNEQNQYGDFNMNDYGNMNGYGSINEDQGMGVPPMNGGGQQGQGMGVPPMNGGGQQGRGMGVPPMNGRGQQPQGMRVPHMNGGGQQGRGMGVPPMNGRGQQPQGMRVSPMNGGGQQGRGMGVPPMNGGGQQGQGMGVPPMNGGGQQGRGMGVPPMNGGGQQGQGMGVPPMNGGGQQGQGMGVPPMNNQQDYYNSGYQNNNQNFGGYSGKGAIRIPRNTTISVHCPKGGVGKSSISKELACIYAQCSVNGEPLKVCLIDMDIDYGDTAIMLGLKQNKSIADWARAIRQQWATVGEKYDINFSYEQIDSCYLLTYQISQEYNLKVLAAPRNHKDSALISNDMVTAIINNLKNIFDVIIVDTGNSVKDFTVKSLELSDRILMVCNSDLTTINEIFTLEKTLSQMQYPMDKISLLMNEVKKDEKNFGEETAQYLKLPLIGQLPKTTSIEQANNNCQLLTLSGQETPFTLELKKVANIILPVVKKGNPKKSKGGNKKPSFWSKLFG